MLRGGEESLYVKWEVLTSNLLRPSHLFMYSKFHVRQIRRRFALGFVPTMWLGYGKAVVFPRGLSSSMSHWS